MLGEKVPTNRVLMAGSCTLNSVANGKVLLETPFTEHCIQLAAGNDGIVFSAALYFGNILLKEGKRWV